MIVVIADDLSGAAELAGVAGKHGLTAEVQTVFDPDTDAQVVCLDIDTRSLSPAEASRKAGDVARAAAASRPEWIYKKCDSVLRGHVVAEIQAIMGATGRMRAMLIPANPSRGRVISGGFYSINGQPLHETKFALDPDWPRLASSVADLLNHDLAGVEIPDVTGSADLARRAESLDGQTLAAGAADFFEALLLAHGFAPCNEPQEVYPPTAPFTVIACGSAASWNQRMGEAAASCVPVLAMPHVVRDVIQALKVHGTVLMGIGDGPATRGILPAELVRLLADSVADVLRLVPVGRLLLEGGATAAAAVRALGFTRFRSMHVGGSGVGALRPVGQTGPLLFIKPGSYDWPREIWSSSPLSPDDSREI